MKIIAGRTIILIKFNCLSGLVTGKYMKKWQIETAMDDWTLEEEDFVPIFNLRKKADRGLYTPNEIFERHKAGIMNALIRKVCSLAKENDGLIEKFSKSSSRLGLGSQGED